MQINKRSHFWNKKAKNYPLYDASENSSAKKLLKKLKERGVEFGDKRVLDIGCGTGRVSIEIAKSAKSVHGVDVSEEMLTLFKSSAENMGVANVVVECGDFEALALNGKYDIVVATMTPALQSMDDFKKAISLANEKFVYVGWGRKRSAPLLERAFELHGAKLHLPFGAPGASVFLKEMGYDAQVEYSEEVWEHEMSIEDAIEEMCWHIEIGGVTPDRSIVEGLIRSEFTDRVKHAHRVETGLIICEI